MPTNDHVTPDPDIIEALRPTQGSYLVEPGSITSASQPPIFNPYLVSPTRNRYHNLLSKEPQTEQERRLQQALCESEAREKARKEQVLEMQATSVLQNLYVRGVQAELQAAADHKKQKGKKKVRLNGDGKPKLLTADEFMELTDRKEEEDRALAAATEHRNNMRYEYHIARGEWEAQERVRKEGNETRRMEYQKALEKWSNAPKGKGSQEKKPVRKPFRKPTPRPKLADFLREGMDDDIDAESDENSSEPDSE